MAGALKLLFHNTFLVPPVTLPLPGRRVAIGADPGFRIRAAEYGSTVRRCGYQLLAPSEVFRRRELESVVDAWPPEARPVVASGPMAGSPTRSRFAVHRSGLRTLVDGPPAVRTESWCFRVGGSRIVDADAWANKGVLLVEIDAGSSRGDLEVYSTHLCWGGGLLPAKRPEGDRREVRAAQLGELAGFIRATHHAPNAMVVGGDFNIDAGWGSEGVVGAEWRTLRAALAPLGFEDVWARHGTGPGWTCDLVKHGAHVGAEDPDDPDFLRDDAAAPGARPAGGPVRIDYVFVAPGGAGGLVPVVERIRRRSFPRVRHQPTTADPMRHLSDHVGLHLELAL